MVVVTGYMERVLDDDGNYTWKACQKPKGKCGKRKMRQKSRLGRSKQSKQKNQPVRTGGNGITIINPGTTTEEISGGGYVETETIVDKKNSGGWIITYQTVITRTYDASGKLVSTKKTGPTEISKVQSVTGSGSAPDASAVRATLSEEYERVSSGLKYRDDIAQSVLSKLNEERTSNGLQALKLSAGSDVYKIAGLRLLIWQSIITRILTHRCMETYPIF